MTRDHCGRKDRLIKEKRHDTYQQSDKRAEMVVCPGCSAVYSNGRWAWKDPEPDAAQASCPACRRIADNYPAGYVAIKGPFFQERRTEIIALIRNIEKLQKNERPLERIIAIEDRDDHTFLTTTGIHLARRIGEALARSYKGVLSFRYADSQTSIRVSWQR